MNDRARLVFGCSMSALGLALSLTVSEDLGTGLLLVGVAIAIFSLHRLGRSGADRWQGPTSANG
jgi:hypothetical protein